MADDGSVVISAKLDTLDVEKGAKKIKSLVDKIGNSKTVKSVSNLSLAFGGVSTAVGAARAAIAKVSETLADLTDAYKVQANAERSLETAAKNNPYLDSASVAALKEYASSLQGASNVGDEAMLPMMARLAAAGRTQTEIQQIMAAALDASAAGAMGMESAVAALNKTFSGTAGEFARSIGEIADLTDEELANGKAVKIVAERYKGMAQAVADSRIQAQNAKGDFKEAVGALAAPASDGWNKFWQSFYEKGIEVVNKIKKALDSDSSEVSALVKNAAQNGLESLSTEELEKYVALQKEASGLTDAQIARYAELVKAGKLLTDEESARLNYLRQQEKLSGGIAGALGGASFSAKDKAELQSLEAKVAALSEEEQILVNAGKLTQSQIKLLDEARSLVKERAAAEKSAAEETRKAAAAAKEEADAVLRAQSAKDLYSETVAAKEREIELRKAAGEEIAAEAEAQELYSAKVAAFLELAKSFKDAGNIYIGGENVLQGIALDAEALRAMAAEEETARAKAEALQDALREMEEAAEGLEEDARELFASADGEKLSDAIRRTIGLLESQKDAFADGEEALDAFDGKIRELQDLLGKVENAEFKSSLDERLALDERAAESLEERRARLNEELKELEAECKAAILESDELTEEERESYLEKYADKVRELKDEIEDATDELAAGQKEKFLALADEIGDYVQKTADIVSDACDLMADAVEAQADAEKAELAEKYEQGLISEEEYEEGIAKIEEEAAMKEYKIQMADWAAQLLSATASIAVGCAKSLEAGMPQGAILAALTAAAGAVQLASIVASKPVKPSFASGGIVPGTSYYGDSVEANVNSGEMVITRSQQKSLWDALSGAGILGGANYPITINNTQSNKVRAAARADGGGLTIDIVDAVVQRRIASGAYDSSFKTYEAKKAGKRYL